MATEIPIDGPARRLSLRRGRGAGGGSSFGGGGTGRVESYQGSEEEPDGVDDVMDLNDAVRARAARSNVVAPVTQGGARDNPRSRLNEVAMAGSPTYAKEYRLTMLGRLLMRGTPLDQIARQLQVSISTVEKDRAELRKRMREQTKELNVEEMIGGQNAFYDEVQAMAMRLASSSDVPTAMKLASMRTSLAANADRTRFLNTAGVFDVLRFRRQEDGSDISDVQMLMQRTAEMLAELNEPEPEVKPPVRSGVIRRKRKGGFNDMTFDDPDASGSGNEVQEL